MPVENDNSVNTKGTELVTQLEEDILIDKAKEQMHVSRRINSIDFVKGFAIVWIILAHTSGAWLNADWVFLHGIVYAFMDIVGPSLFVFLSALSVVFSIKRKQGRLPEKVIKYRIINRGIVIMIIGILFSLISIEVTVAGYPFPLSLYGWNIIFFIGFSQIFSYFCLRLRKLWRIILGFAFIFSSDIIRYYLYIGKEVGILAVQILHYILISPVAMTPLLPWISVCFLGTVFGEMLYQAMEKGTIQAYRKLFKSFLIWGLTFIAVGLFLGMNLFVESDTWNVPAPWYFPIGWDHIGSLPFTEYPHIDLLNIANSQMFIPEIRYPGMPEFMIRGRAPNMIYNQGMALFIIAISFYFIDMKNRDNDFIKMLIYYGQVSLTLFLLHYAFITLFLAYFDVVSFILAYFGYVSLMGFLMYIWNEYYNGVGSPEWLMIQLGNLGRKKSSGSKREETIVQEP